MREFVQCAFCELTVSDKKMALIIVVAVTVKMRKGEVVYSGEGNFCFRMSLGSAPLVLLIKSRVHVKVLE